MKYSCIALALLAVAPAFAQEAPPEIPFDSTPNFFKLPPDLFLGEASGVAVNSKGHVFIFSRAETRLDPPTEPLQRRFWNSGRMAGISVRSVTTFMRGPTRTPSESTRTTTCGPSTKARDMVIKFHSRKAASRWCSDGKKRSLR